MSLRKDGDATRVTENDLPQEFILKLLGQREARGLWGIKHTREPVDLMVKYAKTQELSLPLVQVVITKEGIFVSPISRKSDSKVIECDRVRKSPERRDGERILMNPKAQIHETRVDTDRSMTLKAQSFLKIVKENPGHCESQKTVRNDRGFARIGRLGDRFHFSGNIKEEERIIRPITDLQLLEKFSRFEWRQTGIFFFGIDTISYGVQDLIFTRVFSMIVVMGKKERDLAGAKTPFMCHAFVCESRSTARKVTYALAAAFQAYGRSMKFLKGTQNCKKSTFEEKPRKFVIELSPSSEYAFNDSEA